jgi:dCMP deaminase
MVSGHCVRSTHAEANAIVQGALHGISLAGSTAYTTHEPCVACSKLLISAGALRIVYDQSYPDEDAAALLAEAGVAVVNFAALAPSPAEGAHCDDVSCETASGRRANALPSEVRV